MGVSRREFLKLAGLTAALGLGTGTAFELLAPGQVEAGEYLRSENALRGKRWAMAFDVKKCLANGEDCRICIDACINEHNIPQYDNPLHEIKWIWKDLYRYAFEDTENPYVSDDYKDKPFILLCNHCDEPPCVRVCPTQATFRRPDGIVMQDMHRCIGCRFCMAACPYGSRNFNWLDPRPHIVHYNPKYPTRRRGVVEKCIFCNERIDLGKKPVCVDACPVGAIIFGDLHDPNSELRQVLRKRFSIRRKLELGTKPSMFYLI